MTTPNPNPQAPAGWYPTSGTEQRYWDGRAWTNHTAPLAPDVPTSPDQPHFAALVGAPASDTSSAMLAHLLGIFTGFLGPLIIFLVKKDDDRYTRQHAAEALNFQLTLMVAFLASVLLILVVIGVFLIFAVAIYGFVYAIIGTIAANKGEPFRYPINIRFVS